ncbi:mannitol-1-phosphate 5-dehydrogenase [Lentibacillus sediminis]|uniref:mannitol-1-phosphate 5-dehydrogenase n=1 Tax=Lentibacillus sediminis TaxID=1940529 RepID=UPI000C1C6303|nr:mannitol-1-phosphate 5-dehydrogenase [Lentibacillus sediminis]
MLAVHFGAGNIGRGFIAALLHEAGYQTIFVDVNEEIIKKLNEKQSYQVVLAAENSETLTVENVQGINSLEHPEKAVEALTQADLVTTAVGPNVLGVISELIAKGLRERLKASKQPLNLIACENMIGGSSLLKEKVFEHLTEEERSVFSDIFGFPNAAVDRIVPNQDNEDVLTVAVEPYYEWVVESSGIKGERPAIDGITFVDDLTPYIERKLFTVNTGHAAAAYMGRWFGHETITDAMRDEKVMDTIQGALAESGEALIQTYQFDREAHQAYIQKITDRFQNPYISDEVTRVGRGPIRKLGARDRLIRPASLYMEKTGKQPVYLAKVIAAVMEYKHEADPEAVELQQMIREHGYAEALKTVSQLDAGNPLIDTVLKELEEMKKD